MPRAATGREDATRVQFGGDSANACDPLRAHLVHDGTQVEGEKGENVPEVTLISGHRDRRMLFQYTPPRAEVIAAMLNR